MGLWNKAELIQCCGSTKWASGVAARGPFASFDELAQVADEVWWRLERADWLEAFKAHPKIGEKKAATEGTARTESWSTNEQSGMKSASQQTTEELATLNQEYEEKFGYIFIVCATGKSSAEMLDILRERLRHNPEEDLDIAAAEQAKITKLRLAKLFSET